ncbi:hypothetical protein QBC38DRAFT_474404 [Podospora fimiseda]|uniref:Uncharacterized protein n=1 Tax=Podospora fimiseda TaxID=252190 RepID=A0AAN7BSB1_9PEZI|nr:hypothetical protein QBC38DRAFT_474404 [Podospora fimiseda]
MPAVEMIPKQQQPMEAVPTDERAADKIVSQQPKPEPMPQAENEMTLRGGGMNIGFNKHCCGFNCAFYKNCC